MLAERTYDVLALAAPALDDLATALAASRAGYLGLLDLGGQSAAGATTLLDRARGYGDRFGVRLTRDWSPAPAELDHVLVEGRRQHLLRPRDWSPAPAELDLTDVNLIVLADWPAAVLPAVVAELRRADRPVLVEVTAVETARAALAAGADGLLARGHESGGPVGDETAFVLLQRLVRETDRPVWVAGGIGLHSAAAAVAAGARGVVLDRQLALCVESALPEPVQAAIGRMDGSETVVLGTERGWAVRGYDQPGWPAGEALRAAEQAGEDWREAVLTRLGWGAEEFWPLGQDAALAAGLAATWRTVGGVLQAVGKSINQALADARRQAALGPGAPLAVALGTEFPIAQGPMTRVSDTPEFAAAVAAAGGLPFLALALLPGDRSRALLEQTKAAVGERRWGVGILGFVPPELREEQLRAILEVRPDQVLIAGGRPSQAKALEEAGLPTWLHVPSPRLLERFLAEGARRFIFEGRECGGHIGPRSSFVLWDQSVAALLAAGEVAGECQVLFAGGIHDDRSAAAVAALAAPLVERGAQVGVLMGTAYLFCREAVETGAIVAGFQAEAVECDRTAVIETSPGHAIRVAPTPAVDVFRQRRRELEAAGLGPREVATELERLNLGRLRIASKGLDRGADPEGPRYVPVDEAEQHRQGLYMVGQVAALRSATLTIRELHETVARSVERLPEFVVEPARPVAEPEAPIAIVGMATILPGATDAETYWENILAKVDAVTEVPPERWDPAVYYADHGRRGGDKTYSKWGGFLDAIRFDPLDYGIPPNSLRTIEPVHLLALETVKRALIDAGYGERPFCRERTAVIFGAGGGSSDLSNAFGFRGMMAHFLSRKPGLPDAAELIDQLNGVLPDWCEDTFPGVLINVIAGRVANRFNFGGANFTVDAACASSLAAVDAAVKELRLGHADVAIAGGADTTQDIFSYLLFTNSLVLSPGGRCRTFDDSADGIAISEGVAVVVLKRLADAERDGDRIYAVIRGIAGSSDGRALGLTAPNLEGQRRAVEQAYLRSGVSPATVELVEAHGTGTAVGDRTEVQALTQVFQPSGAEVGQVAIGSVKSNIGHTKCAAGLASLCKTARALYHRVLPPTLHVEQVNRKAGFGENPFYPNLDTRPWLNGTHPHPRRAGVSAFGFGGTNFHLVVEEYARDLSPRPPATRRRSSELLVWQGADRSELLAEVTRLRQALAAGATPELCELALTLAETRGAGPARLALVARERADLAEKLAVAEARLRGEAAPGRGVWLTDRPLLAEGQLVGLFPGQGSQAVDMLAELAVAFPAVAATLEEADAALLEWFPKGLSRFIYPPSSYSPEERRAREAALTATEVAQPALGAVAVALLRLLRSLGVEPDLWAGHSYGELVALHAAGALEFADLLTLSAERGRAMAAAAGSGGGAMAAIMAPAEQVAALLTERPEVVLANLNAPAQTVIAGPEAALDKVLAAAGEAGLRARKLPVSAAFHSPLVAAAAERVTAAAERLTWRPLAQPVFSNTTAAPHGTDLPVALGRHLCSPVRFVEEIDALYAAGGRVFIEIGPGRVLTGLTERCLGDRPHAALAADGPAGVDALHELLAQLYIHGAELNFAPLYAGRAARRLNLSRLVEETTPPPPSPTTWLVNGGRAWPATGALEPPAAEQPARPAPAAQKPSAPAPAAALDPGDPLSVFQATMRQALEDQQRLLRETLDSQQRLMQQYLETQERVLSAYLTGRPAPRPMAPVEKPAIEPAEAPAEVPATEPEAPETPPAAAVDLQGALVQLIAERTGYPPAAIDVDADLEADLGIDSIKRLEILGMLQDVLPAGASASVEEGLEELAQQKTIRQVVGWLETRLTSGADAPAEPAASVPVAVPEVRRYRVALTPAPPAGPRRALTENLVVAVIDRRRLGDELDRRLLALRQVPRAVAALPTSVAEAREIATELRQAGEIGGLIYLGGPTDEADDELSGLFLLTQALAGDLRRAAADGFGVTLAVTGDGAGGLHDGQPTAAAGAVLGLGKALARELPEVTVRALDLAAELAPGEAAEALVTEQLAGATVEIGRRADGRWTLTCVPRETEPAPLTLPPGSVALLTGGARGITAEVAAALAAAGAATLILVGRTPLPSEPEPAETAGLVDPAALKAALASRLGGLEPAAPRQIEAAYRALLREREIRATLARLTAAGVEVEYRALDVRDEAAFGALLDEIYATHGRLDVVIHGAGVIHDKRLADKSLEAFREVVATKLAPARVLATRLRPESLRCLVFFASVAGRFGNVGQTDYAAANEALSKLARRLDGQWPGRVVAVAWGPWDEVGMVQPELRRLMTERGVALVPPRRGCELLLAELAEDGEPEVVIAGLGDGGAPAL